MAKVLLIGAGVGIALHGLIHLLGFVAYWPLAVLPEMPYKTTLLGGQFDVGRVGMRVYGLLWLLAALGFVAAAAALLKGEGWWRSVMLAALLFSTALIILDWAPAFRGAVINLLILVGIVLAYIAPGLLTR